MTTTFDHLLDRVSAGEDLGADELAELAAGHDILLLGTLADLTRRRLHGNRATYLRVAQCAHDRPFESAVSPAARELRVTGAPETLDAALKAVAAARTAAQDRTVSGFSWADVERLAAGAGSTCAQVLAALRSAGLDAIAEVPLDTVSDVDAAVDRLTSAGFEKVRLTLEKASAGLRPALLQKGGELQQRFGCIHAFNPLPAVVTTFRPTTGYDDVKAVAIARLAAPNVATIQVDWLRYGPKLAQVALTFGADDLDGVTDSDEAPDGRRRAPLEEVRRGIEAAGFSPVERDGRFQVVS